MTNHDDLLAAALSYAERGWHVFPLRPGSKFPAVPNHRAVDCDRSDPKCRGGHTGWEERATTDPDRIERCWGRPGRPPGIGIATGPSNLVVVDLDVPKSADRDRRTGAQVLCELADAAGAPLPEPYTVATPSKGWHLYFHAPQRGERVGNTTAKVGPHIDVRAAGGYVVAPPTRTPDGAYAVTRGGEPWPLPGWILARVRTAPSIPSRQVPPRTPSAGTAGSPVELAGRAERYIDAAVAAEVARVVLAPGGQRNQTLYLAAVALGQLVAGGLVDQTRAVEALEAAAAGHVGIDGFTGAEVAATVASGLTEGARKPRRLPRTLTTTTTRPDRRLGGAA